MRFTETFIAAALVSLAAAQTLNIPARVGSVQVAFDRLIERDTDFGNAEYDSNIPCTDAEGARPVFRIANGVTIRNLIIGPRQRDGIHCLGTCTLINVWFRDVCEDAISALGRGATVTIQGGGANGAVDKVIQHNERGTVSVSDYTVTNSGKLYRSCGDCSNNQARSPRHVTLRNIRAFNMGSDLVGINSNFGDTATFGPACGSNSRDVCANYIGVNGPGTSTKVTGAGAKNGCRGDAVSQRTSLPACSP